MNDFDMTREAFVTSHFKSVQPWMMLVYRSSMMIICFPLLGFVLKTFGVGFIFLFFTFWNWTMFGVFFTLGTIFSFRHVFLKNYDLTAKIGVLEKFYLIILEVELPATVLISIVVWILILPGTLQTGTEEEVLNPRSYFVHGINVFLMGGEFVMNKLYFKHAHFFYLAQWGSLYVLFHTILMFVRDLNDEDHCPTYGFLNLSTEVFIVWYLALLFLFYLSYLLIFGLSKYKYKVVQRKLNKQEETKEKDDSKQETAQQSV